MMIHNDALRAKANKKQQNSIYPAHWQLILMYFKLVSETSFNKTGGLILVEPTFFYRNSFSKRK
jgi:hypothetical protein